LTAESEADFKKSDLSTKLKVLEKKLSFKPSVIKHYLASLNFCQPQPAAGSKLDSRRRGYLRLSRTQ
jgi:hypothetical protein